MTTLAGYILADQDNLAATIDQARMGSDHSSNSLVLRAVKDGRFFALKIFPVSDEKLLFEQRIYARVQHIAAMWRNRVEFISAQPVDHPQLRSYFSKSPGPLTMTVTQLTTHTDLDTFLKTLNKSFYDDTVLAPLFFQMLWAVHTLHQNGIQHNDMHPGNILVIDTWPNSDRLYKVNSNLFQLPTNAPRLLFFDWDLADSSADPNPDLKTDRKNNCAVHGLCPGLNERIDVFRTMVMFLQSTFKNRSSPLAAEFLNHITDGPRGSQPLAFAFSRVYPCNGKPCQPYQPDMPSEIHPASTLLDHPFFNTLRRNGPVATVAWYLANALRF